MLKNGRNTFFIVPVCRHIDGGANLISDLDIYNASLMVFLLTFLQHKARQIPLTCKPGHFTVLLKILSNFPLYWKQNPSGPSVGAPAIPLNSSPASLLVCTVLVSLLFFMDIRNTVLGLLYGVCTFCSFDRGFSFSLLSYVLKHHVRVFP